MLLKALTCASAFACLHVCVDALVCGGGADVSDHGAVLLQKLCRQPSAFEGATQRNGLREVANEGLDVPKMRKVMD